MKNSNPNVYDLYISRLKELREEPINYIRQKELAKLLNIHVSTYSKYENKIAIMPLNDLNTICNYFNVSLDYILHFNNLRNYKNIKPNFNSKLFCERFKAFRKENKLTQEKLSLILNTDQSVISKYEKGTRQISTENLCIICNKYHISADYLMGKIDKI